MKNKSKLNPSRISTTFITICFGMSVAGTLNAANLTWTGGAGDGDLFATPGNWSDDATSLPPASVLAADRLTIGNGDTVSRTANITVNRVTVLGGSTLNVTAGSHSDNAGGATGSRNLIGNSSTGVVNQSGATTSYNIGQMLAIAHSTNSNGTFNQTGGTLNISRSQSSQIGNWGGTTFPGHTTTSFNATHSLQIGGPSGSTNISGLYEISGGSLLTRAGVGIGMNGTFSLVGSGVTAITLGGSNSLIKRQISVIAPIDGSVSDMCIRTSTVH